MHKFLETLGGAGAIGVVLVAVIVVLTLFYRALSWLQGDRGLNSDAIAIRGVLRKNTLVTVHLEDGKVFERVRLLGFSSAAGKGRLPFELTGMMILEDEAKLRLLVPAKSIRMVEIPPEAKSPTS